MTAPLNSTVLCTRAKMSFGKTCGKCKYFLKINFNDKPTFYQRNGICEKYDYNICSDGTYAQKCSGYTGKRYNRHSTHNKPMQNDTNNGAFDL